jgi:hypothetical protein
VGKENVMSSLKPLDVVFVMHRKNPISKMMAWFMGSRWSHSAAVAEVGYFDIYLHETSDTQTKVGLMSFYISNPDDEIEVIRVLSELDYNMAIPEVRKFHNKMYGYVRMVGAGLRRLLMKLGWKRCPMILPIGGPLCMMIPHAGLKTKFIGMPEIGSIDTEELYQWCKDYGKTVATKKQGEVTLTYIGE